VYRWVEHTGELELRIEAPTEEAVFTDALAAFAELVGDPVGPASERREVELADDDRGLLLAEWLNELVYLADAEGFVPERADALDLGSGRLRAAVIGRRGDPSPLVKAVTLHGLRFASEDGGPWRARLVLDV
jgi:SHS2 domain-containing protein